MSGNGAVIPGGLGRACTDDCTFRALRGKTVELRAIGRGDVFHQWNQRCGRVHTCKVEMTGDVDLRAEFGLDRYEPGWAVSITSTECVFLHDVAAADEVVVAGNFTGTATFGRAQLTSAGDHDALVAAIRPHSGDIVWTRQFGGKGSEDASSVALLAGHGPVTQLSIAGGATVGNRTAPGPQDVVAWLDEIDGTVSAAAPMTGTIGELRRADDGGAVVATSRGPTLSTVARFRSGGAPSWSADLAASVSLFVRDLAVGPSGDVFVLGRLRGVPLFATAGPPRAGEFVAQLDGVSGAVKHTSWLGSARFTGHIASDGRMLILIGSVGPEAFVLGMSFEGDVHWERRYQRGHGESTVSINRVDASPGSVVVAGTLEGEHELANRRLGRPRATTSFLLEISPNGDELWAYELPANAGRALALARDTDGDLYIIGWFSEPFTFGGKTVAAHPSGQVCRSAYLAKLVRTGDRSPRPPPAP